MPWAQSGSGCWTMTPWLHLLQGSQVREKLSSHLLRGPTFPHHIPQSPQPQPYQTEL